MWETLVAVLIGGAMSLTGVWLTSHLSIRERRKERLAVADAERRAFARATLTDLNVALTKTMRDTVVVHFADSDAARDTGVYAGHLLPEDLERGHLERAHQLAHLISLVLDDDLREKVSTLQARMGRQSRPGPRTQQEADTEFAALADEYENVQRDIGTAIRKLWSPLWRS